MHRLAALLNAVLFFLFWLIVLYAGADHPPSPGFVAGVLLDLIAAGLVYWRVPIYLAWIASRRRNALLFVVVVASVSADNVPGTLHDESVQRIGLRRAGDVT